MSKGRFTDSWCSETGEIGITDNGGDIVFQGESFLKFLNELNDENIRLKEKNRALEFKIVDMLDFIKEKGIVTHSEMKEWWNERMKE